MNSLQEFKDEFARSIYGETAGEERSKGLCIQCKQPALERCYSPAGIKEYKISGLCEKCFDSLFEE